ncbi:MAG: hypothetical protein OJF50_003199 [Nitrospira sp.]|nr:hypothetical protein [Nitrospira sp.]
MDEDQEEVSGCSARMGWSVHRYNGSSLSQTELGHIVTLSEIPLQFFNNRKSH